MEWEGEGERKEERRKRSKKSEARKKGARAGPRCCFHTVIVRQRRMVRWGLRHRWGLSVRARPCALSRCFLAVNVKRVGVRKGHVEVAHCN